MTERWQLPTAIIPAPTIVRVRPVSPFGIGWQLLIAADPPSADSFCRL
jgi:hypothetical protein